MLLLLSFFVQCLGEEFSGAFGNKWGSWTGLFIEGHKTEDEHMAVDAGC